MAVRASALAVSSTLACLALACLAAAGCSPSSSPPAKATADKPAAAAHDHDHHDHDHGHDHDRPESFPAGIAQLQATVAAVKDHLAVGATDAADEAVHALGHLIEDVQGLLSKEEEMTAEARAKAAQALDDLFDCFDKLDTALHAPEGTSPPPAEVHASLAERIDGAIGALQSTLPR